jgi:muramoyltetrapeptide carboxypeptidase
MSITPPYLQPGDTVAIVSPAKAIEPQYIHVAKSFWEAKGYQVKVGKHALGRNNYFSGTDAERLADFQEALDDPEVKAIVCARGGYGCVRIVDRINWSGMLDHPKWVVGFSDVTVFHQYLNRLGVASLHATMPLNYEENSPEALATMLTQLEGSWNSMTWESDEPANFSVAGELVGGNLAVLTGLIGTDAMPDYTGNILFLEDVGEYYYTLDRMLYTLHKSGVMDKISGLIVGDFSNIKDTEHPFGSDLKQLFKEHMKYRNIPLVFGLPLGHCADNRAIVSGMSVSFSCTNTTIVLQQNEH